MTSKKDPPSSKQDPADMLAGQPLEVLVEVLATAAGQLKGLKGAELRRHVTELTGQVQSLVQSIDHRVADDDARKAAAHEVERLIDTLDGQGRAQLHRISHRPREMTEFFLEMYGSKIRELEGKIEAWRAELRDRETPPERRRELRELIAWAEAELDRIRPHVAPLAMPVWQEGT